MPTRLLASESKPFQSRSKVEIPGLVRRRLVPSRYLCVFGVREDWGLGWGARGLIGSYEGKIASLFLRTFPWDLARLNLTPNLLSPQKHINSDWVRVCRSSWFGRPGEWPYFQGRFSIKRCLINTPWWKLELLVLPITWLHFGKKTFFLFISAMGWSMSRRFQRLTLSFFFLLLLCTIWRAAFLSVFTAVSKANT